MKKIYWYEVVVRKVEDGKIEAKEKYVTKESANESYNDWIQFNKNHGQNEKYKTWCYLCYMDDSEEWQYIIATNLYTENDNYIMISDKFKE